MGSGYCSTIISVFGEELYCCILVVLYVYGGVICTRPLVGVILTLQSHMVHYTLRQVVHWRVDRIGIYWPTSLFCVALRYL